MYREHVPTINASMRASVAGFKRGVLFAVLSIRQPVTLVPDQLDALDAGDYSPLFGWKMRAFEYLESHGAELMRDVLSASNEADAIDALCRVPGLGIVKAGFVLQFLGFDVACLDTRNIKREGRNPRAFRSDGDKRKSGPAWRAKIVRYLGEVQGKAEHYWDAWCSDVAEVYGQTAEQISELHLAAVHKPREYDLAETF